MTDIVDALRDPISMSMFRRKDDMIGYLLAIRGESAAEIERLRLALSEARATGRREGMEEIIAIAEDYASDAMPGSEYRRACADITEAARAALKEMGE